MHRMRHFSQLETARMFRVPPALRHSLFEARGERGGDAAGDVGLAGGQCRDLGFERSTA